MTWSEPVLQAIWVRNWSVTVWCWRDKELVSYCLMMARWGTGQLLSNDGAMRNWSVTVWWWRDEELVSYWLMMARRGTGQLLFDDGAMRNWSVSVWWWRDEELVSYCLMMARKCSGLTTSSIKIMTFELAIKMVLPSIFSTTRKSRPEVVV